MRAVAHAVEAGQALNEAKRVIGHGEWLAWLKANVTFSERTARLYTRMADAMPTLSDEDRQRVANLSLREAAKALSNLDRSNPSTTSSTMDGAREGGKTPPSTLQELKNAWRHASKQTRLKFLRDAPADFVELVVENAPNPGSIACWAMNRLPGDEQLEFCERRLAFINRGQHTTPTETAVAAAESPTVFVQAIDGDDGLDIPDFLKRKADGTFKHPEVRP
jgi:hypothetical protein